MSKCDKCHNDKPCKGKRDGSCNNKKEHGNTPDGVCEHRKVRKSEDGRSFTKQNNNKLIKD